MAQADYYTIRDGEGDKGEKLTLGQIIARCEQIAKTNKDGKRYFVGRETIRGRLRCGVRTWDGLTARTKTHSQRVRSHVWRGKPSGSGTTHVRPRRHHPDDSIYEPEGYTGPDEDLDRYG